MLLDELKKEFYELTNEFKKLNNNIDISKKKNRVKSLEQLTLSSDFWLDPNKAQGIIQEMNGENELIDKFNRVKDIYETIDLTVTLAEEGEIINEPETKALIKEFYQINEELTLNILLNEEYDKFNAIIEFHPGAGGTESQDWAQMLFRMYLRYADRKDFKTKILDYIDGDEAGLKSATVLITGPYAYGYLKAESGVHRLVRISPFDSSSRRHTSFASVTVIPEIDESIQIDINEEDLRIDTFRSSGKGGQGVNTTDSAVRITHIPTGIVVSCQNERSQIQNREIALRVLKGKLYNLELEKKHDYLESFNEYKANAFGSQIRSYVFHPYTMVKDHRTNFETGNGDRVLDGDLDPFILAYLVKSKRDV
ncbi:MAG TPA: peptide chain release factor 2 [Bacillota bacterium]|mgnify:CR=1 FL=1|nr:peptide chain release factor 2 [Bacillota bacterium]